MTKKGADLSEWNGSIDFSKTGLDFVILRTGYGQGNPDKRLAEYAKGAKEAGIDIPAVYHFSYAISRQDAINEADECIRLIKENGIRCKAIYFDWEYDSDRYMIKQARHSASRDELDTLIRAFCERVKESGYEAGVYFNLDYMQNRISPEVINSYKKWYARYDHHPEITADIWQYTDTGKVDGIAGNVDMDYIMEEGTGMTYEQIKNECLGKSFDMDGAYGAQCWDFAAYVMKHYYGGFPIHCGLSGYACDIALQRHTNGILTFMKDVGLEATLKPGDICVWGNGAPDCPYSHIALYDHDDGQDAVYFLGQNQSGHPYVDIERISTAGIIGVFRPRNLSQSKMIAETGTATIKDGHSINLRLGSPTGRVIGQLEAGESLVYDHKIVTNGHRYIVAGNLYLAISPTEDHANLWVDIQ